MARDLAVQAPRRPKSTNPFTRAQEEEWRRRNKTVLTYVAAAAVGMLGMSYAAVPLYRLYCQVGAGADHWAMSCWEGCPRLSAKEATGSKR